MRQAISLAVPREAVALSGVAEEVVHGTELVVLLHRHEGVEVRPDVVSDFSTFRRLFLTRSSIISACVA